MNLVQSCPLCGTSLPSSESIHAPTGCELDNTRREVSQIIYNLMGALEQAQPRAPRHALAAGRRRSRAIALSGGTDHSSVGGNFTQPKIYP